MDKIQRLRMAQARALAQGDRRSFLMTAAGVGGSAVMGRAQAAGRALEAYADSTSIRAGDGIALRARDPDGSSSRDIRYPLQVVRLGWPDQLMLGESAAAPSAHRCRHPWLRLADQLHRAHPLVLAQWPVPGAFRQR